MSIVSILTVLSVATIYAPRWRSWPQPRRGALAELAAPAPPPAARRPPPAARRWPMTTATRPQPVAGCVARWPAPRSWRRWPPMTTARRPWRSWPPVAELATLAADDNRPRSWGGAGQRAKQPAGALQRFRGLQGSWRGRYARPIVPPVSTLTRLPVVRVARPVSVVRVGAIVPPDPTG